MSFDAFETSIDSGKPVEVYTVVAGLTTYRWTSAQDEQTVSASTYTPVLGLKRGKFTTDPANREQDFQFEVPTENALAQLFVGNQPGIRIRVTVDKFHRDDLPTPELREVFDGYVQSASFKDSGKRCIFTARETLASVSRQVPRRVYSSACNHVLYDPSTCQVDDTDVAFRAASLTVASVVDTVITVTSGLSGTYVDGWFDAGFVEAVGDSDFRLIIQHAGNVVTVLTPFATAPALVNVFAGCGHRIVDCKDDFDNVDRFGGFAFVPYRNPYSTGIL